MQWRWVRVSPSARHTISSGNARASRKEGEQTMSWRIQLTANLIATFCGVLFALLVSDCSKSKSEKQFLVELFLQARSELLYESGAVTGSLSVPHIPKERVLDIRCFDEVAANPLVVKYSPVLSSLLRGERRFLNMSRAVIYSSSPQDSLKARIAILRSYGAIVDASRESLELGAKYFSGEISRAAMEEKAEELVRRVSKIHEESFTTAGP